MAEKRIEQKLLREVIKPGDILAEVNYVQVVSYDYDHPGFYPQRSLKVRDLKTDLTYAVRGEALIDQYESADHYDREEKVIRTQLAKIFVDVGYLPFTVVFVKADGKERTLRGHLVEHETYMGRSTVFDLDVISGSPLRQVDHRTLKSLIVNRVKYSVKGT